MKKRETSANLRIPLFTFFLLFFYKSVAQTDFFNSNIGFSKNQLEEFYSSFTIDDTQIYFVANDYQLHVFDKKSGKQIWQDYLGNKTNNPPRNHERSIIVTKYLSGENSRKNSFILNAESGEKIAELPFSSINTLPYFKDNIMFCTAIEDGGQIVAYDLSVNKMLWKKFIAHGVDTRPYYLKDKILVNAEADNWLVLNYQGQPIETNCREKEESFIDSVKICLKKFKYLNHKQKEISSEFVDSQLDQTDVEVAYLNDYTVLMSDINIVFINDRNKVKKEISVNSIFDEIESENYGISKILHVNETTLTFLFRNVIVHFNHIQNKTIKTYDVNKWNPHQAVLEGSKLWLISRNDGELYGLNLQ